MKSVKTRAALLCCLLLTIAWSSYSQSIGIGTSAPNASAAVDITHSSKGLLIPRISTTAINNITNPAKGLMVYDSSTNQLMVNMGSSTAVNWQSIASKSAWNLGGNSGVNVVTQFIGTTDNRPLRIRVNGILAGEISPGTGNVSWGLRTNTLGYSNIAIGTDALKLNNGKANLIAIGDSALFNNSFGSTVAGQGVGNTAIGSKALYSNTTGHTNTAAGLESLYSNTLGFSNTAYGGRALYSNTTASAGTAIGYQALYSNTTGVDNTAIGYQAMITNSTGQGNTAVGFHSLYNNTAGDYNTAYGYQSMAYNTTGESNIAIGHRALFTNVSGGSNVAIGKRALNDNLTGSYNTAIGNETLILPDGSSNNTVLGYQAGYGYNAGSNNTYIGVRTGANVPGAGDNVAIGYQSFATGSNQVILGNGNTTLIGGYVGFSNLSDGRFKRNIQENVHGLSFIMKLRPVTYQMDLSQLNTKLNPNYKELDESFKNSMINKEKTIFTGFIAQEVEQAANETGFDFSGVVRPQSEKDMYSLRYAEFVVPLVKAIQEQQRIIEQLKKRIEELEKNNDSCFTNTTSYQLR